MSPEIFAISSVFLISIISSWLVVQCKGKKQAPPPAAAVKGTNPAQNPAAAPQPAAASSVPATPFDMKTADSKKTDKADEPKKTPGVKTAATPTDGDKKDAKNADKNPIDKTQEESNKGGGKKKEPIRDDEDTLKRVESLKPEKSDA